MSLDRRTDTVMIRLHSKITAAQAGTAFTAGTFNSYGYNDRSEVTAGKKYTGTDISDKTNPVTTYDYGYDYDPIGNRTGSVAGAAPAPITTTYTANALNQYSTWSIGGGTPLTPQYDDNGNVSEYLNSTGTSVAHYEYSPFGRTTVENGTKAADFAHRFSTKYLDVFDPEGSGETGLYYYGTRCYSPVLGRWLNRDPLPLVTPVSEKL